MQDVIEFILVFLTVYIPLAVVSFIINNAVLDKNVVKI